MSNRDSLLALINQLPEENLVPLIQMAQSLQSTHPGISDPRQDLQAMLQMPLQQRTQLLQEQAAILAPYFQPQTEAMEWTEDYIEDRWEE